MVSAAAQGVPVVGQVDQMEVAAVLVGPAADQMAAEVAQEGLVDDQMGAVNSVLRVRLPRKVLPSVFL